MRICFMGESLIASVTKEGTKNNQQQLHCTQNPCMLNLKKNLENLKNILNIFFVTIFVKVEAQKLPTYLSVPSLSF